MVIESYCEAVPTKEGFQMTFVGTMFSICTGYVYCILDVVVFEISKHRGLHIMSYFILSLPNVSLFFILMVSEQRKID